MMVHNDRLLMLHIMKKMGILMPHLVDGVYSSMLARFLSGQYKNG